MSHASESFSALDHIEAGDWDRWLHRLHGAIHQRQQTQEYKDTLVAGLPIHRTQATFPPGTCSTCGGGGCPDCTDPA